MYSKRCKNKKIIFMLLVYSKILFFGSMICPKWYELKRFNPVTRSCKCYFHLQDRALDEWIMCHWYIIREDSDWEVNLFTSFFDRLYSNMVSCNVVDRMMWSPFRKGFFEVKSSYNYYVRMMGSLFHGYLFGEKKKVTHRVHFFILTMHLGRFLNWIMWGSEGCSSQLVFHV